MIDYTCDYNNFGHSSVMNALLNAENKVYKAYGEDDLSKMASDCIRDICNNQNLDVHYIAGGTMCNKLALAAMLNRFDAVIASSKAHIANLETGAIQSNGNPIIQIDTKDGKIYPKDIDDLFINRLDSSSPHRSRAAAIYISQTTELGGIYSLQEIKNLYKKAKQYNMYLYVDGARLASACASVGKELFYCLAHFSDAFYIGGTKCGAMFGEALVLVNDDLKPYFKHLIKQQGAMLAKGFIVPLQIYTLLKDDLYIDIAKQQNNIAKQLADLFLNYGFKLAYPQESNQIFLIMEEKQQKLLSTIINFCQTEKIDDKTSVYRFVVGVNNLVKELEEIKAFLEQNKNIFLTKIN